TDLAKNTNPEGEAPPPEPVITAEVEYCKAVMHLRFNNLQEALTTIQEAIKLNPKEPDYLIMQAQAQMKLDIQNSGEPSALVGELLSRAQQLNPNYFRPHFELGIYYKLKKNTSKALSYFRQALERKPSMLEAEREIRVLEKREAAPK